MGVLVAGLGISGGGSVLAATPISGVTTFNGPEYALVSGVANGAGVLAEDVFGYDFLLVTNAADPVGLYVGDLIWETGNGVQYYPDSGNAVSMWIFPVRRPQPKGDQIIVPTP